MKGQRAEGGTAGFRNEKQYCRQPEPPGLPGDNISCLDEGRDGSGGCAGRYHAVQRPRRSKECGGIIKEIRKLYDSDIPIFAICLGHQLMALATGRIRKR